MITLLDETLRYERPLGISVETWATLARARTTAKRFIFSSTASAAVGRFACECGDLVLRHRQFAAPPFERMYIEIDADTFTLPFRELHQQYLKHEDLDVRVGFVIDGYEVYTVVQSGRANGPPLSGYVKWRITPPGKPAGRDTPQLLLDTGSRMERLAIALGSTLLKLESEEQRLQIQDEFAIRWAGDEWALKRLMRESVPRLLGGNAGEVRNLWALLLWLNQPTRYHRVDEPAGAVLLRGRRVAYARSTTIEIDLGKVKTIRSALKFEDRASPVRHQVRGSWHHRQGDVHCVHEWPTLPDGEGHFTCARCGRLRYWVKDHVRGDSTRGYNDGEYAVRSQGH